MEQEACGYSTYCASYFLTQLSQRSNERPLNASYTHTYLGECPESVNDAEVQLKFCLYLSRHRPHKAEFGLLKDFLGQFVDDAYKTALLDEH